MSDLPAGLGRRGLLAAALLPLLAACGRKSGLELPEKEAPKKSGKSASPDGKDALSPPAGVTP